MKNNLSFSSSIFSSIIASAAFLTSVAASADAQHTTERVADRGNLVLAVHFRAVLTPDAKTGQSRERVAAGKIVLTPEIQRSFDFGMRVACRMSLDGTKTFADIDVGDGVGQITVWGGGRHISISDFTAPTLDDLRGSTQVSFPAGLEARSVQVRFAPADSSDALPVLLLPTTRTGRFPAPKAPDVPSCFVYKGD